MSIDLSNAALIKTRVGFIGLGSQGGPMAPRIVESGYPLTIWARRPESLEPYADTAASVAPTPAELGAASDVVGICVMGDADVEDVLLRADGVLEGMTSGGVVAIHSTIHPDTCVRVAEHAARRGVGVVDAPVSGGGGAATQRKLLVMVGGEDEHLAACRPVFETFADPVVHVGPLGSGQMAKLINNLVFTALVTAGLETFAFADELGMDRDALAQVLANGSGGSRAAAILAGTGFDLSGMRQAVGNLQKDVRLVLDVARGRHASEPPGIVELAQRTLVTLVGGQRFNRRLNPSAVRGGAFRAPTRPGRVRPQAVVPLRAGGGSRTTVPLKLSCENTPRRFASVTIVSHSSTDFSWTGEKILPSSATRPPMSSTSCTPPDSPPSRRPRRRFWRSIWWASPSSSKSSVRSSLWAARVSSSRRWRGT